MRVYLMDTNTPAAETTVASSTEAASARLPLQFNATVRVAVIVPENVEISRSRPARGATSLAVLLLPQSRMADATFLPFALLPLHK